MFIEFSLYFQELEFYFHGRREPEVLVLNDNGNSTLSFPLRILLFLVPVNTQKKKKLKFYSCVSYHQKPSLTIALFSKRVSSLFIMSLPSPHLHGTLDSQRITQEC